MACGQGLVPTSARGCEPRTRASLCLYFLLCKTETIRAPPPPRLLSREGQHSFIRSFIHLFLHSVCAKGLPWGRPRGASVNKDSVLPARGALSHVLEHCLRLDLRKRPLFFV